MVNITKVGNGVRIVFDANSHYLYKDGEITVPTNSLLLVVDESDMADFKLSSNNDNLFSSLISNIKINGTQCTKSNIEALFASVATSSGGGGGAVNSVNGQVGDVVLTASDVNAIEEAPQDGKQYGRKDATWTEIIGGGGNILPNDTNPPSFDKNKYVYIDDDSTHFAVLRDIFPLPNQFGGGVDLIHGLWGDTNIGVVRNIPRATNTTDGVMSSDDKAKLDSANFDNYYTKTEVDGQMNGKADTTYVDSQLSTKADITYVDSQLADKADKEDLNNKLTSLTNFQQLNGDLLFNKAYDGQYFADIMPTATTTNDGIMSYEDKLKLDSIGDIPTVQTNGLGDDTQYIYSNRQDISKKALSKVAPIQNEYGLYLGQQFWGDEFNYITIEVEAASSTKYGSMSPSDKVKLDATPLFWYGTQAEYDAIVTKDNNTLYFIYQ